MYGRRYFILEEPCPPSAIKSMMGRVVAYKTLPLQRFAPFMPLTASVPRHNAEDIISSILPPPSLSTSRRDVLSTASDDSVHIALTSLFGIDLARSDEERIELESMEVKRYALENPSEYFDLLMESELYAADVQKLFAQTGKAHAYLVTGFLTTRGAVWTRSQVKTSRRGFAVTAPVAELAGVPLPPGVGDISIAPSRLKVTAMENQMRVAEEEIFAVCYSIVKISHGFDRNSRYFTRKTPKVGAPKRAKPKQLALSDDEGEEEQKQAGEEEKRDAATGTESDLLQPDFFLADDDDFEDDDDKEPSLEIS